MSSPISLSHFTETAKDHKYLVVAQNGLFYGFDTRQIIELIEHPQLQALPNPHLPTFIAGVINLRGEILSALNLETILYGEPQTRRTDGNQQVGVVLETKEERICLLAPEVLGVFSFKRDHLITEFPFIPGLHSTSSISAIILTPFEDNEKEEIVEIIDIETLLSNYHAEWTRWRHEAPSKVGSVDPLPEPTEEEITQFDLTRESESYFERQEKLRQLKLKDFLLIQFGAFNFGIPLPFIKRAFLASEVRTSEENSHYPIRDWMTLEDTKIPVIDPRDLLFVDTPPPCSADYSIIAINYDHNTFAIVVDKIIAVVKVSLVDQKEFRDTLKRFDYLNLSLVENLAYLPLDDQIPPFPVLEMSKMVKLLFENKSVAKSLAKFFPELDKEVKTKNNYSKEEIPKKSKKKPNKMR